MSIVVWILQILLALHTATGAVWKLSHSEQTVPSLGAIPHTVWLSMSVFEMLCSLALVLPIIRKRWSRLAYLAAMCIGAEMVVFCVVHLLSGRAEHGEMIYWLVVAAVCAFVAYGRGVRSTAGSPSPSGVAAG